MHVSVFVPLQVFEANDLLQGQNFSKVLNCLVALNKATSGELHLKTCITSAVWQDVYKIIKRHLVYYQHGLAVFVLSTVFTQKWAKPDIIDPS